MSGMVMMVLIVVDALVCGSDSIVAVILLLLLLLLLVMLIRIDGLLVRSWLAGLGHRLVMMALIRVVMGALGTRLMI